MKITALVENQTKTDLRTAHGLSLYIEAAGHKMLFDVGPNDALFENAPRLGVDLTQVDLVVISHGHRDHGGALGKFLEVNEQAKVYIQRRAFEPHLSKPTGMVKDISLDAALMDHPRVVLLDGDFKIDDELEVFTVTKTDRCYSSANDTLYEGDEKDTFRHEQYLIIHEKAEMPGPDGADAKEPRTVLIMGCGHTGIVNILDRAKAYHPTVCIGGYHLFNPETKQRVSDELLDEMIREMCSYEGAQYYTCHCTGQESFEYMNARMDNMHYLACGDQLEI